MSGIDGLMAILIFVLSLILLIAGAASGYQSLDLLPTSLWAFCMRSRARSPLRRRW